MQAAIPLVIGGGLLTAGSGYLAGQNQSRISTIAAGQIEKNANRAEYAAGQRKAQSQLKAGEDSRQTKKLISKQINMAAAQGASTSEKNISDLIADTAAEGRYRSLVDLYEGDISADQLLNEAYGLRAKASATRYEGRQARKAANIGAFSSILQTGASAGMLQSRSLYGRGGNLAPTDPNNNLASGYSSISDYGDLYDF